MRITIFCGYSKLIMKNIWNKLQELLNTCKIHHLIFNGLINILKIDNHHKITTRHGIFQTFFGRQQLQRTWFKEVETNKGATTTKVWFSKRDNQCRFRNRRNDANLKDRLHPSLSVATSVAVPS